MKEIFILAFVLLSATIVSAQWTNDGTNLTTSDDVGIGITKPASSLDIAKRINANDRATISLQGYGATTKYWIISGTEGSNTLMIGGAGNSLPTSAPLNIVSGKIGIGTSSPTETLEVNGLIKIPMASSSDNNSPGIVAVSNDDFLYDSEYINHYGFGFHGYQDGTSGFANPRNAYISGYFGLDLFTGGKNRFRISRHGEVSIGTANRQAGYLLSVNGKIKSKEIKVEADWSDFVFENDYKLRTLEEVESYITQNKHLPEIPNEAEVAENGINLGEMDAKLLMKIEELTLYMIDMNKRMGQLEQENAELKEEISALKKANEGS